MSRSFFQDNIYTGLFFGMITPVIGFYAIQLLFEVLVNFGLMEEVTGSGVQRRFRTTSLLAVCALLIPFQIFIKKRFMIAPKGILIITFLLAGFWVFYFRESIFVF